jgi:hypothetical protein
MLRRQAAGARSQADLDDAETDVQRILEHGATPVDGPARAGGARRWHSNAATGARRAPPRPPMPVLRRYRRGRPARRRGRSWGATRCSGRAADRRKAQVLELLPTHLTEAHQPTACDAQRWAHVKLSTATGGRVACGSAARARQARCRRAERVQRRPPAPPGRTGGRIFLHLVETAGLRGCGGL